MTSLDLMTTKQVATALGIPRREVVRIVKAGELKPQKLPGRTGAYLFRSDDVLAYKATQRERSAA